MTKTLPRYIVFDADGTLCDRDTGALRPGVEDTIRRLRREGRALAIATNQGGVGCRALGGFGHPERYPTEAEALRRYRALARKLGVPRLYVAFAYQAKSGEWSPTPARTSRPDFWRHDWRKPAPGMLLRAMRDAGVGPAGTLMVGDRPEDQAAARAAGCNFQWADEFFGRR